MAKFDTDGYFSSVTYPVEFHRQYTPVWLNLATLICGHRPKPLDRPFRWCDIGCGQGFTALSVAALYPHAEIYGFDFNPSHIENANRLASDAGVTNACFADVSFETLANATTGDWPKMDFIVMHGVWSWISATQRSHILRFIARHLAPGGVVYNGYNALAGWGALLPVQKLLRQFSASRPAVSGATIVAQATALLRDLIKNNAVFFTDNPIADRRLKFLGEQDVNYFCHEMLHEHWTPFSPDEVAADFASVQCGYIGSATLLENFDVFSVPQAMVPMLASTTDLAQKEILRDFGSARMFRRDLFRRGTEPPLPGDWLEGLDQITLTDLGLPDDGTMKIKTWGDEGLVLRADIYGPVRQGLRSGALSLRDLRGIFPDTATLTELIAVLTATGAAHPTPFIVASETQQMRARALNQVMSRINAAGGHVHMLAAPRLGTMLAVGAGEQTLAMAFAAADTNNAVDEVALYFAASGRELLHAGQPVLEPEALLAGWRQVAGNFAATRLKLLRTLGVPA